jgi:N,N-dimethylformamidase
VLSETDAALTLEAYVFPTLPGTAAEGLLTRWDASTNTGYALVLDEQGALAFWAGDGERIVRMSTGVALDAFTWYAVSASLDPAGGRVELAQAPVRAWPIGAAPVRVTRPCELVPQVSPAPFLIGAWSDLSEPRWHDVAGHFNGKIDRPRVLRGSTLLADWDFSREIHTSRVVDASDSGLHGVAVNMPMRGVTGHNFSGRETDFRLIPEEYGAIFFHDDDLEDARWAVDFRLTVSAGLRSGVYAARLRAGEDEDHIPFFVRPPAGTATARAALLLPTYTYLAYANSHPEHPGPPLDHDVEELLMAADHYAKSERLLSFYDLHRDGIGNCYASRLRPLASMRPKYVLAEIKGPTEFSDDLHLVDWLEAMGFAYDVITDEDLRAEGASLLERYRVVISGTHNEYWTADMLDGLEAYLAGGGRFMYLSGNGLYWPIGVDPERPHIIEVRRGHNGTSTWRSRFGETHLSTTGEIGGIWRDRGRAPQKFVGVGFTAAGFDRSLPYYREPGSFDPRAAFIFEGVAADEPIGDTGLVMGGAAGLEIDRVDYALGSPPHTLILASARGFSSSYQRVVEEVEWTDDKQGGPDSPFVRADLAFFETPGGGAVFSTGSITWCGCLSAAGYANAASRIMQNVLGAFMSDGPLPAGT